jgi:hypothetical protein
VTRIAIVGTMHSGKTTLANALVKQGFVRLALADPLKDAACDMLTLFIDTYVSYFPDRWDASYGGWAHPAIPIDRQEIEDGKAVFRPFLQWLGSEFAREYLKNSDCWLQMFEARLEGTERFASDMGHPPARVVCDDVRFPNEADYLRRLGFQIVRIRRNEEERLASIRSTLGVPGSLLHQTETNIDRIAPDGEAYFSADDFQWHIERYAERLARGSNQIAEVA